MDEHDTVILFERLGFGGFATGLAVILAITTVAKEQFDKDLSSAVTQSAWAMMCFVLCVLAAIIHRTLDEGRPAYFLARIAALASLAGLIFMARTCKSLVLHFGMDLTYLVIVFGTGVLVTAVLAFWPKP